MLYIIANKQPKSNVETLSGAFMLYVVGNKKAYCPVKQAFCTVVAVIFLFFPTVRRNSQFDGGSMAFTHLKQLLIRAMWADS